MKQHTQKKNLQFSRVSFFSQMLERQTSETQGLRGTTVSSLYSWLPSRQPGEERSNSHQTHTRPHVSYSTFYSEEEIILPGRTRLCFSHESCYVRVGKFSLMLKNQFHFSYDETSLKKKRREHFEIMTFQGTFTNFLHYSQSRQKSNPVSSWVWFCFLWCGICHLERCKRRFGALVLITAIVDGRSRGNLSWGCLRRGGLASTPDQYSPSPRAVVYV